MTRFARWKYSVLIWRREPCSYSITFSSLRMSTRPAVPAKKIIDGFGNGDVSFFVAVFWKFLM